ncbi:sulfite exporter TauE/SafE family protein [Acinetobacter gerneri]|uniref:Probable membrane transporter protein n=1 Tax=Acinetobacter gerneri TaxID=202952 RepID=A0AAW8JMY0_9GAMM|nr:sulfite exporter TauE/SafE family protein [Acinetobacter gerneri]MDQ9011934.1 sulfite exporter TauE/SafE family protein [Acinetobacter gerneri]MDQ9016046.1 sulfite exporter TauE/SafE family protein [Acinetobacter gerneri]MDQ9027210.1 sulfite exporter TauE/SafE family protein [Acinetobacter gerneri]MDQ9054510.1 sulfite exporter TauE/SafE family protein [Acinetobacter gerneri]MDQ9062161.1 sulfite exporter TauE/SafE family protein [Acinetobacter gerneri]
MELIIFLAIGALAGFAAGLFGVGGGLVIVPILYVVFTQMGYDPAVVMHLALGTSLATIIVTSISSLMAHNKNGAVLWPVFKNLAPGLVVGSFLGAGIAGLLSREHLQLVIGVFVIWVAYNMFMGAKKVVDENKALPSTAAQVAAGTGIGVASAIFGIGGGSLTVPYLNHSGVVMQKAVGTSAACGLPIAIAGALGFMFFGMKEQINVPNTIGFIHIYAFFGISLMSFFTAKIGAKAAHILSPSMLKKCFAIMLFVVGCFFLFKSLA